MLVTACVEVSSANDASQDYKALQLGGIAPRGGFVAQILASLLEMTSFLSPSPFPIRPSDQGQINRGILVDNFIPWWPVIIGFAIGGIAVTIEGLHVVSGSREGFV